MVILANYDVIPKTYLIRSFLGGDSGKSSSAYRISGLTTTSWFGSPRHPVIAAKKMSCLPPFLKNVSTTQGWFQGPPRTWDPLMVSFPYHSHIYRDFDGNDMGIVWVPLTIRRSHVLGGPWKSHRTTTLTSGGNKLDGPMRSDQPTEKDGSDHFTAQCQLVPWTSQ